VTQPALDEGLSTGQVVAATAIGLALIAIEARVRQQVEDDISAAYATIAATAVLLASTAPATAFTGIALLSLPRFHQTLTTSLDTARRRVREQISSGYTAASQLAYTSTRADLNEDDLPDAVPELGDNLDRLLSDIDTMFGHAQTDTQNGIADAFDGVQDPDARSARLLAINQAALRSRDRLNQRAQASGTTAVHSGANDTLNVLFNHYQTETGIPGLMKRWRVTALDPCGMCDALDATMVGINAEFDHNATTNDKDLRRVWRNLPGPPRHPNCRCQLELVMT
jgi:hypothetical protein